MITSITKILLAVQLLIVVGLSLLFYSYFQIENVLLACMLGLSVVCLFRAAITANNFYLSWLYRSKTPEEFCIDWRQAGRLFANEFKSSMMCSSWTMAFYSFTKRPVENPAGLPVLLIHGYGCNSGYWHNMSKTLVREHITHHAVNLEPIFAEIEEYVASIAQAANELRNETGAEKIIIVAHSMGGLAVRAYLRQHGTAGIAKIITLGTPHHGTGIANFGRGLNCRQMRWIGNAALGKQCEWLEELENSEDAKTHSLFVSIYSHHDNIVSPQLSCRLSNAKNIELSGIGHVALGLNNKVIRLVLQEIKTSSSKANSDSLAAVDYV